MSRADGQAALRQGLGPAGDAGGVVVLAHNGDHASAAMHEAQPIALGARRGCRIAKADAGLLVEQA